MNQKFVITIALVLALAITGITGNALAKESHVGINYAVGQADGCADIKSGTSDARNGHSNADSHSAAYEAGYLAGQTQCAPALTQVTDNSQNTGGDNNQNQNNRNQVQGQTVSHSPQGCFVLLGSCNNTIAQGQSLPN